MKTSLKINLLLFLIIVSYLLIVVHGEHLGGALGLSIFMNLFSRELAYGLIPTLGIILLIVAMFVNRKGILYGVSMIFLYLCLILYIISLIKDKEFVNELTPILSMIPFVILTIIGSFILKFKTEISK